MQMHTKSFSHPWIISFYFINNFLPADTSTRRLSGHVAVHTWRGTWIPGQGKPREHAISHGHCRWATAQETLHSFWIALPSAIPSGPLTFKVAQVGSLRFCLWSCFNFCLKHAITIRVSLVILSIQANYIYGVWTRSQTFGVCQSL